MKRLKNGLGIHEYDDDERPVCEVCGKPCCDDEAEGWENGDWCVPCIVDPKNEDRL